MNQILYLFYVQLIQNYKSRLAVPKDTCTVQTQTDLKIESSFTQTEPIEPKLYNDIEIQTDTIEIAEHKGYICFSTFF